MSTEQGFDQNDAIPPPRIRVNGWKWTRLIPKAELQQRRRWGGIPVLWTPTIKALWSSLWVPPLSNDVNAQKVQVQPTEKDDLPLLRIRLSASAIKVIFLGGRHPGENNISQKDFGDDSTATIKDLGFSLVLDNVLIEISEQVGFL